jgi:twinkle protein
MFTGIPGHGKDEFANELMVSLARNQQMVWAVFNFEEPPAIHSTKLMEKYSKKAFAFRRNPEHRMNKNDFEKGVLFVQDHFHQANVGNIDVTIDGIIKKATELVMRHGVNGIIINPWNYLEHKRSEGQSETEYVSEVLTKLCNFLWKYGVHCFLVAHPTKINKDKQTGKYEVPTLYSISGSAHFFNKTHNGICVYRHFDTNTTDIIIQKVKWYWLGQTGWASYHFDTDIRQYKFEATSVIKKYEYNNHLPAGSFIPVQQADLQFNQDEDPFPLN